MNSILANILNRKPSWRESILGTDAYKFSMMAGGRPLETEVFYLSYRKGGRLYMPVDLEQVVRDLLPEMWPTQVEEDLAYLTSKGFPVSYAAAELIGGARELDDLYDIVYAVPKGEWVDPREPVLTIRGPQALVSWLEPLLIGRIMYQMQVATALLRASTPVDLTKLKDARAFMDSIATVTCEEQKRLTIEACRGALEADLKAATEAQRQEALRNLDRHITVDEEGYYNAVKAQCQKLLDTGVAPNRFFEVGLRAATCMEQHLIALKALKDMGFNLTSNVYGAAVLDMVPVGTLGHEGIMRWGGNDKEAFEAHMAALPKVTFLLDTNDTLEVGLPTAIELMKAHPDRMDGVRPDSGDLNEQFRAYVEALWTNDIRPRPWIFEDGLDENSVAHFEELRASLHYPEEMTLYGLGGYFIDRPEYTPYKRGAISMIYKLTWTERYGAVMKFGNEEENGDSGKQSLPGIPVTLVRVYESDTDPRIMVGQEGHEPEGYAYFTVKDSRYRSEEVPSRPALCPHTQLYIQACTQERQATIDAHQE